MKDFKFSEERHVEFWSESFNFINHVNFATPTYFQNNGSFGQITGTIGNPRLMQVSLKIVF